VNARAWSAVEAVLAGEATANDQPAGRVPNGAAGSAIVTCGGRGRDHRATEPTWFPPRPPDRRGEALDLQALAPCVAGAIE